MSLKASSIRMLGTTLAAMGAMAVATASASAAPLTCEEAGSTAPLCLNFVQFEASGSLIDKKLNEPIPLNEGRFNGYLELVSLAPITGFVHGLVTSQPQEIPTRLFGHNAKLTVTFEQVGITSGTLNQIPVEGSPNCERIPTEVCVNLSVPTEANIGFTSLTSSGTNFSMNCKTSKPISFPLSENLMLNEELLNFAVGSHFVGTTDFPPVTCAKEPRQNKNERLLTETFSGPDNPYSLFIRRT